MAEVAERVQVGRIVRVATVSDRDRVVLLQLAAPQASVLVGVHPTSAALRLWGGLGEGTAG